MLPILEQYLVYAPLQDFAALVNESAVRRIRDGLTSSPARTEGALSEVVAALAPVGDRAPRPRQGALHPQFLGLITTRGCNLACRYCGFVPDGEPVQVMDLRVVRDAVDWYLDLVARQGGGTAEVHFFGGEPFSAPEVVDFAYHYARLKAAADDVEVRFEVATNGVFGEERAWWLAESFDDVIVSLDGPADVQDYHRPRRNGRGTYEAVTRTAAILSEGSAALSFRACVTADTAGRMPEIATWLCQEFRPASICFEPVQPTEGCDFLAPPDPWRFARLFVDAARVIESFGVEPVYSASDIRVRRVSFCPVGSDTVIVAPDGTLRACYLLRRHWEKQGLDLVLGRIEAGAVSLDEVPLAVTRGLNVWNKPSCRACFCKWHCAGGCHVNHVLAGESGRYGRLCIQTRLIALRNVLAAIGEEGLVDGLFDDGSALARVACQPSDSIADVP